LLFGNCEECRPFYDSTNTVANEYFTTTLTSTRTQVETYIYQNVKSHLITKHPQFGQQEQQQLKGWRLLIAVLIFFAFYPAFARFFGSTLLKRSALIQHHLQPRPPSRPLASCLQWKTSSSLASRPHQRLPVPSWGGERCECWASHLRKRW